MNLVAIILIGALVGWIASMLTGKDSQMGALANIGIGIIGSIIGGFLYTLLTDGNLSLSTAFLNLSIGGLAVSILGAVLLISVLKRMNRDNVL
jgi:uncharacterized membrane protein YeaQ/YmgE (transglycosylase-associated protein family)